MASVDNAVTRSLGIDVPLICGAMYPCSNPELVAAASQAGAIGIIQPMSLTYVYHYDFREGLRYIRSLTSRPVGLNLIVERSSRTYQQRSRRWLEIALEEDIRFFVTALGDPGWVVGRTAPQGAVVYHDVVNRRHADKAFAAGVDGFICVNNRAGGHAGALCPEQLLEEIAPLGKPTICAGGIGSPGEFKRALAMGYDGAQLGTRFIATQECEAHADYKQAILDAGAQDIVLTEKISGVPVSVIRTPYIEKTGTQAPWLARKLLRGRRTRHWMRLFYTFQSVWKLKKATLQGMGYKDFFQAGKSVEAIDSIKTVAGVVNEFFEASKK